MAVASARRWSSTAWTVPACSPPRSGATVYAVSAVFVALGLLGLLRSRAPGHAFVLMVGESLVPLALCFPRVGFGAAAAERRRVRLMPVTLAIASIAGGLCFVSVSGLLWRFDDEERGVFALACAAFWLLSASTGLEAIRAWLGGGTIDQRWAVATAVAGLGVWLIASVHPAMGSGAPPGPTLPAALGDRRRFVIAALVLMTGPVLIAEYAQRGTIRKPMWMAVGTAVVLALVTAYLLRLAGRAGRLEQLAQRDQLTGVALRTLFVDRLGQALARGRRDGTGVAVMFVDLDRFKQINDSLGHAAGNDVLRFAAHRLEKVVGRSGLVGRVGRRRVHRVRRRPRPATTTSAVCSRSSRRSSSRSRRKAATCSLRRASARRGSRTAASDADTFLRQRRHGDVQGEAAWSGRVRDIPAGVEPTGAGPGVARVAAAQRRSTAGSSACITSPRSACATALSSASRRCSVGRTPSEGLLLPGAFIHLAEESGLIVPARRVGT